MKILFVIESFAAGGKERQLLELIKSLKEFEEINYRVLLYKSEIDYDISSIEKNKIILSKKRSNNIIEWFNLLKNTIREFRPDVIHSWENMTSLFSYILKPLYKYVLIDGSLRTSKKNSPLKLEYYYSKLSFLIADIIVSNSYRALVVNGVADFKKSKVIYNGFDEKRYANISNIEHKISYDIICVANFSNAKDHKTLIEAILNILKKGTKINTLLIGDGPQRASSFELIPNEFNDYFHFTGKIQNVERYILNSKIGVLLSNPNFAAEGISNSIMEYMAAGLPVIVTNDGGSPEIVENNLNGFLIDPFDKIELEDKIIRLLSDEDIYKRFSIRSKEIIQNKFSLLKMRNDYVALYLEIKKCSGK